MYGLSSLTTILIIVMLPGCKTQDPQDPVTKAKALVEGDKEMIASFAHPTATLQSADYLNRVDENGGFKLVYKFNYDSMLKNPFDSTLGFVFENDGHYQRSTVEGTSGKVKPYVAATLARAAIPYDFFARTLVPDARKKTDPQPVQDYILKMGGSEAVFRNTGSPWKQKRPEKPKRLG